QRFTSAKRAAARATGDADRDAGGDLGAVLTAAAVIDAHALPRTKASQAQLAVGARVIGVVAQDRADARLHFAIVVGLGDRHTLLRGRAHGLADRAQVLAKAVDAHGPVLARGFTWAARELAQAARADLAFVALVAG